MAGGYETVPGTGADSYQMADPSGYTDQAAGNIFGQNANNLINAGLGAMNQWNANSSDPNSMMSKFLNDFGGLQGAVTDSTSDLSQQLKSQVSDMTREATQAVGSQFAGLGGLRSSGMANMAGQEAGRIAGRAATDLGSQQLGLLNTMGNQAMGGRMGAMGQMMGMPSQMMGLQGQFGEPMYAQPQVAAGTSALDWMSGIGSMLGGIGSMIPGLG